MKTEILLLFFCLLNPGTEDAAKSAARSNEGTKVVVEAKLDKFSPLFLLEL